MHLTIETTHRAETMPEFRSWRSYWDFQRATKYRTRYVHDPEVREFLESVLGTCRDRIETIPKASVLWRAQLGHSWSPVYEDGEHIDDVPAPYPPKRMKPPSSRASEGRANPKGIPYLYVATSRDTAMAEVRPWIGSFVSVAQFVTLRTLKVVNCTTDRRGIHIWFKEPPPKKREESVWRDIDRAFANPVSPSDDVADYVPTQIIAELFKSEGLDGVAYRSSLGSGHNIALFDLEAAELMNCSLFEVKSIDFDFKEAANPYFMRKHCNQKEPEKGSD